MKLQVYLEKQVRKAIKHQDEHPLSGSANRAVKEAQTALLDYENQVAAWEANSTSDDMETLHHFFRD